MRVAGHYNGRDPAAPNTSGAIVPVENVAIARVLAEIGDLLEIKGENPFKVRAYRNASQVVRDSAERVAGLSPADLRALPGIGKDIAGRIAELVETGGSTFHRELAAEFPAGLLDVLRLQGVGPKTAALLYKEIGVLVVCLGYIFFGLIRHLRRPKAQMFSDEEEEDAE